MYVLLNVHIPCKHLEYLQTFILFQRLAFNNGQLCFFERMVVCDSPNLLLCYVYVCVVLILVLNIYHFTNIISRHYFLLVNIIV